MNSIPPDRVDVRFLEQYPEFLEFRQNHKPTDAVAVIPEEFEKLIVKLLVNMGYGGSSAEAGRHIGKTGDGGVDGVIDEDKLGLDVIYLQAKRYAPTNTVGRPEIQQFAGTLIGMGSSKGVFVTTSRFASTAMNTPGMFLSALF